MWRLLLQPPPRSEVVIRETCSNGVSRYALRCSTRFCFRCREFFLLLRELSFLPEEVLIFPNRLREHLDIYLSSPRTLSLARVSRDQSRQSFLTDPLLPPVSIPFLVMKVLQGHLGEEK